MVVEMNEISQLLFNITQILFNIGIVLWVFIIGMRLNKLEVKK